MKNSDGNSPAPHRPRNGVKSGVLVVALGLALGGTVYFRQRPAANAEPAMKAEAPAPDTIAAAAEEALKKAESSPTGNAETDKALAKLSQAVRRNGGKSEVWQSLGDMLAQAQRDTADAKYYDLAEAVYMKALALKPENTGAMAGMAWVTGGRHLFEQSTSWANKALAVDEGNVEARGILGDAALEIGEYDAAYEQYQKMMDLRPDLSSWSRGAHLLWVTGDKSKAMWLMERAIKAGAPYAENTAWCRARLAMMLFHDGAYPPAANLLEPALEAKTRNTHVLLAAGRIAAGERDYPRAMGYYQTVLEGGPNLEALAALGDLHAVTGEKEKAEECYMEVEALHAANLKNKTHDHTVMARFYADHDRNPEEARKLAEQHGMTHNVQEADAQAWAYFKSGDLPKAVEAMKRALKKNTPDAEMRYHAGMIAAAFGDRASAQKHLQAALSMNPGFNPLQAPLAVKKLEELGGAGPAVADAATGGK